MDATRQLKDWAIQFLKHKDVILRKIESIEETNDGFVVKHKDGSSREFLVSPWLTDVAGRIRQKDTEARLGVVVASNKRNISSLVEAWPVVKEYRHLSVYFANPGAEGERKWIVMPYTHDKICDQSSLAAGLKSMAELVEEFSP